MKAWKNEWMKLVGAKGWETARTYKRRLALESERIPQISAIPLTVWPWASHLTTLNSIFFIVKWNAPIITLFSGLIMFSNHTDFGVNKLYIQTLALAIMNWLTLSAFKANVLSMAYKVLLDVDPASCSNTTFFLHFLFYYFLSHRVMGRTVSPKFMCCSSNLLCDCIWR